MPTVDRAPTLAASSRLPRRAPALSRGHQTRRHDRAPGTAVRCSLGELQDVSVNGMRVTMRRVPPQAGHMFTTRLEGSGVAANVAGVVRWVRRNGFFRHHVGVEFVGLDPAAKAALARLSGQVRRAAMRPPQLRLVGLDEA